MSLKTADQFHRFAVRVLRGLQATRKKLSAVVVERVINGFYTHSKEARESLLAFVDTSAADEDKMEVNGVAFWSGYTI